jgi:hypothetical protein
MTKLNTKIVPLTYERYQALIDTSPKTDQEVQCDIVNNKSDILRETPCKRRGQRVLWHMEDNDMHWDDEERLVMGEQTVANTNIVNIIKDVCSDDDSSIGSRHSKDFFKVLILTNFDFKYGKIDQ